MISTTFVAADSLYLGELTPKNELDVNCVLELNKDEIISDVIVIEFEDTGFSAGNNSISLSRVNMELKNQRININSKVTEIEPDQMFKDAIGYFIPITMKFKPIDKPGTYRNNLVIRTINGEILLEKEIIFKINRWTRYDFGYNNNLQIMNSDLQNNKVTSTNPLIIKISSNTDWELNGHLNELGQELLNKISINDRNERKNELKRYVLLDKSPKQISIGKMTVDENNYWTILDMYLEIEEVSNIKADLKKFPVIFNLSTTN
jgi:hypothetical protein